MYGRSEAIGTEDLSFFVGSFLIQICLGAFDLRLNFDSPSIGIMIQSSFAVRVSDQELAKHDITMGHLLRPFLNLDVTAASWAERGTLILTFEGNGQIYVFDDSDQYESYTVCHRDKTIII